MASEDYDKFVPRRGDGATRAFTQVDNIESDADEFLDVLRTGVTEQSRADAVVQDHEVGATLKVKSLYAAAHSYCSCCKIWDDERPVDNADADLRELTERQRARFAVLKRLDRHGRGTWKVHSIVVNSKLVQNRLIDLFRDYPSVDAHALGLTFTPPFVEFVHLWEELLALRDAEPNRSSREHMALLIDLLRPETESAFKILKNIEDTGFVAFNDLILVYIVGEVVIQTVAGTRSAGLLRDVTLLKDASGSYYIFTVDVVEWNGKTFGAREQSWMLSEYKGGRPLKELNVVPLRACENPEDTKQNLVARGRTFEALRGYHFRSYTGDAAILEKMRMDPYGRSMRRLVPVSARSCWCRIVC